MKLIGVFGALALVLAAGAAQAAPCRTHGSPAAQAVPLPTGDVQKDLLWGIVLSTGLSDVTEPPKLAKMAGCPRLGFTADGRNYQLSGDAGDTYPRLARPADRKGASFALVGLLDFTDTVAAEVAGRKAPESRLVFGLVSLDDKTASLRRVYTAIPDDFRLAQDVRLSLADKLPAIVALNFAGRQITVFLETADDPQVEAKGPCDGAGSADAQVVLSSRSFYNEAVMYPAIGVAGAAIGDTVHPRALIAAADAKGCTRAVFKSHGLSYDLRSAPGGAPVVRYAVTGDDKAEVAYLLRAPSVEDGFDWMGIDKAARARDFHAKGEAYVLAVEGGDGRAAVFRYYDAVPDDRRLAGDMSAALAGRIPPLFQLMLGSENLRIAKPPQDQPDSPGAGDSSRMTHGTKPDGTTFLARDDGAAIHAATRFACPERIEGHDREVLLVFSPDDGGRDVGCRYRADGGWFTLYLTRVEPGMDAAEVFQTYMLEAKTVAPPKQAVSPPLAPGGASGPQYAAFWTDAEGQVQGLWVARYGDWYVKQRATYAPGDEAAMASAATAVFRQAGETFAP